MSSLFGGGDKGLIRRKSNETREGLLRHLLTAGEDLDTKTETPHPFEQSVFDLAAFEYSTTDDQYAMLGVKPEDVPKDEKGEAIPLSAGQMLMYFRTRLFTNYISHNRLSRTETVEGMKQVEFGEQKAAAEKAARFGF